MTYLIDGLILLLLAGTLGYAFLVDRRVRILMLTLRELQPMIGKFSAAVDRSEHSVSTLKSVTQSMAAATPDTAPAEPAQAATQAEPPARARQATPDPKHGVTSVTGKSDMVRSFFETARKREA